MRYVTRCVNQSPLAPGFYGPFEFEGGSFRLLRVGPVFYDPSNTQEWWELRQHFCQPERMALPLDTTETEALRRFGFVLR